MAVTETQIPPRPGLLATVRNRRGLIASVEPFEAGAEGTCHLVSIEYVDPDGPREETLIWEREIKPQLLEPTKPPDVARTDAMRRDEFDALVRAARWTALSPFVDPDGREGPLERLPLASPLHGAIQVEDFQLVPLLKALRMPRVSLLLADDVGLGKTIEAGLILTELILRRRVRRVMILCPASLRTQWKQEMRDKFSLTVDIVDRAATHALQKRLGLDANPWRTFPRIVTSYDYLKQPDVIEQFRAACRVPRGSPHLPWDLLVVDEAHNLSPAPFGEDSELAKMLKQISPSFEHRLFLTATPHNGHTRSFTGLLEYLDPVRFTRKSEQLTDAEKGRVEQVVVRRLKREINQAGPEQRFADRRLHAVSLALTSKERALSEAFSCFRKKVRSLVSARARGDQLAGAFAVEVLGKRLLSCPVAFADSWYRYEEGLAGAEEAAADEVRAAERAAREETSDDREAEGRTRHAVRTVGAWLKPLAADLTDEMEAVERALAALGLKTIDGSVVEIDPECDARFNALCSLIETRLQSQKSVFLPDERLIVFTEYKTTLDYLKRRLRARYSEAGVVRVLYGGMDQEAGDEGKRDDITEAFNQPEDPVRILVATDAASEGLNLQETARYLLHYDIPWNPTRLEQRNGRLDRHGQARDVVVFHFTSNDDADVKFLAYVADKVNTIREDLGSMGQVFDRAVERRLISGDDAGKVQKELDAGIKQARGSVEIPRHREIETGEEEMKKLNALAEELDLDPETLHDTLDVALGLGTERPRLDGPDERGRFRLRQPIPAAWQDLIDDTLRVNGKLNRRGALARLLFDRTRLLRKVGPRVVFRPERDTVLLHLGHPVFHRLLNVFAQKRFPGASEVGRATCWTVRRGPVPAGADALLLLTVEELAVNELRETFHHWVRTIQVPVRGGELAKSLPHIPAAKLRLGTTGAPSRQEVSNARDLWEEIEGDVRDLVKELGNELTARLGRELAGEGERARARETERFKQRWGEVSTRIVENTESRLRRELTELEAKARQGVLFDSAGYLRELEQSRAKREEELRRRQAHFEELREQLKEERARVLDQIVPKRFSLRTKAQVFPVAVEIRLPEEQE